MVATRGRVVRAGTRLGAILVCLLALDVAVAAARVRAARPRVVERDTGRRLAETRPFGEHARIVLVWATVTGSKVLCRAPPFLRYLERLSVAAGERMDDPSSAALIDAFVEDYAVDLADLGCGIREFSTLNEFFARPLRPGARPVEGGADVAVCPADGRLSCFATTGEERDVHVKGHAYDVARLLGLAHPSSGGPARGPVAAFHDGAGPAGFAVAVCRLAPGDYHRFHWPVEGRWSDGVLQVAGEYHSVAALPGRGPLPVLGRNRRLVVVVDSAEFGDVAIVVVGAVKVGSIELTAEPGVVARGAEMGRFRYGASTVVVLFRQPSIRFDAALAANSAAGLETLVRTGSRLGRATRSVGP